MTSARSQPMHLPCLILAETTITRAQCFVVGQQLGPYESLLVLICATSPRSLCVRLNDGAESEWIEMK
jgi:hypothetical protein